jgi:hypothetical protein
MPLRQAKLTAFEQQFDSHYLLCINSLSENLRANNEKVMLAQAHLVWLAERFFWLDATARRWRKRGKGCAANRVLGFSLAATF